MWRAGLNKQEASVNNRSKVVIVGGGFGGLCAAQALKSAPVEVTLIDRRNFHLFQPLLYQVATGSLSPGEIAAPFRGIMSRQKNARVLLGDVIDVNPQAKCVLLADGANVEYDSLIVAAGSQSSYYGHDAWRAWAPSLKSVEEAIEIRHKICMDLKSPSGSLIHPRGARGSLSSLWAPDLQGLKLPERSGKSLGKH
jgi:NADH dehydrogenase